MGLNLDLTMMLGVPRRLKCPRCGRSGASAFDDYDVECGKPNPRAGEWALSVYCHHCGHEWVYAFEVKLEVST